MSAIFTFLTLRGAMLVLAMLSTSVMALVTIPNNQPTPDPFAPYAGILLGQTHDSISHPEFDCQFDYMTSLEESCRLTLENGIFSEIYIWIAQDTGRIKVAFMPREKTLTLGDLMLLWGKPEIAIYSKTINFRWPNAHVTAVLQAYPGHISYWLPITYVAFESIEQ